MRGRDGTSHQRNQERTRREEGASGCEQSRQDARRWIVARLLAIARVASRARCVASRCAVQRRPFVRSRELVAPFLLSLSHSLPLSRGSRAAAPKLPEIIGFFCFPVIRRMALRRSMSFLPVPVTLCSHIRSFVAFPPSSRSQFPLLPLIYPRQRPRDCCRHGLPSDFLPKRMLVEFNILRHINCIYFFSSFSQRMLLLILISDISRKWRGVLCIFLTWQSSRALRNITILGLNRYDSLFYTCNMNKSIPSNIYKFWKFYTMRKRLKCKEVYSQLLVTKVLGSDTLFFVDSTTSFRLLATAFDRLKTLRALAYF